ncbi:hypothetical protein TrRE_jg10837, partial [Triparma retinervis]
MRLHSLKGCDVGGSKPSKGGDFGLACGHPSPSSDHTLRDMDTNIIHEVVANFNPQRTAPTALWTHRAELACELMIRMFQLAILLAMPLRMCWWFVDIKPRGSRLRTTSASRPGGKLSNTTSKKQRMAWRAPAPLLVLVFSLTLLSRVGLVASTVVDFRVTSKGWYDRDATYAQFYVDDDLVVSGHSGFNLVTLTTGAPAGFAVTEIATGLNMYTDPSGSSQTLYDVINVVPTNTIVCASVADTPKGITSTGFAGLHMIGATTPTQGSALDTYGTVGGSTYS